MKNFFYNLVVRRIVAALLGLRQGLKERSLKTYDMVFERDQYEYKSILIGWGMILAWLLSSLAIGILSAWPHMSLEALAITTGIAALIMPFLVYPLSALLGGEVMYVLEEKTAPTLQTMHSLLAVESIQSDIVWRNIPRSKVAVLFDPPSLDAAGRPPYGNPGRGIINVNDGDY